MRIGIACYPSVGGSGVVATELATALSERGHSVCIFTFAPPHRSTPGLCVQIVDVFAYPLLRYPPYDLALASAIVDYVQRDGPLDLLHVHYAVPHAISAFLARAMLGNGSFATVTTLHGTDISIVGSDPAYATVTRFGIEQSDGVTAVSESLRRQTEQGLRVQRAIEVIPNFVDLSVFRPLPKDPAAPPRLIHASNLRAVKRPLDVVRILERVRRRVPARLTLVGDGPERGAVLDLARDLELLPFVDHLGPVQIPAEAIGSSDVLLLPSEQESFGLSALEALSCEVPVVASRVGGLPEVVRHGENGFLLEVGDVEGMSDAVVDLLLDAPKRAAFGEAGRRVAGAQFSRDRVVDRYLAFYEKTIRSRR